MEPPRAGARGVLARRRLLSRLGLVAIVGMAQLGSPAPAFGQAAGATPQSASAQAIALGEQGISLFEQGRWQEALQRFESAEAAYHSPVFVLFAARCLRNFGQLLEAATAFARVEREPLAPTAPVQWAKAQREARAEHAALARTIPSVVVLLENASPRAVVRVDARRIEAGQRVELNPGVHRVSVVDGASSDSRGVTLTASGAVTRVTLHLPSVAVPSRRALDAGAPWLGWALLGTGAAASIAGVVLGGVTLSAASTARSELPELCQAMICPVSRRAQVEAVIGPLEDRAFAAGALLIGGVATAAVGVLILALEGNAGPAVAGSRPWGPFELRF